VLTQRGSDRRRGVCRAGGNLEFDETSDFLGHEKTVIRYPLSVIR
jgi:hypothetical protein